MAQEHEFRKAEVSAAARQADAFERIADSLETLVAWVTTPPVPLGAPHGWDALKAAADNAGVSLRSFAGADVTEKPRR